MWVYKAEPDCYYINYHNRWYEAVRKEGIIEVEPDGVDDMVEYMGAVLMDAEEIVLGDTPLWVLNLLEEVTT